MLVAALSLEDWSFVAQIAAGIGVALVVVQIWLGLRNSRVELVTGMTTLLAEIDRAFLEYPHLWKYFRRSTPPPAKDTTDGDRVRVIAVTMGNILDHVVDHLRKMDWRSRHAWRLYIYEVHNGSPVLKELLEENPDWWPFLHRQLERGDPRNRGALARRFL